MTRQNFETKNEFAFAEINRDKLTQAVDIVSKVVEKKSTANALTCAHIDSYNNVTKIKGTDMDISISVQIDCQSNGRLNAVTPCGKLKDILKKSSKTQDVSFNKSEDDKIGLNVGKTKFQLNDDGAADPDFFPSPIIDYPSSFLISGSDLLKLFTKTKDAVSTEETRYYLNGIYAHEIDGNLRFCATDGHRLFVQDIDAPSGCNKTMPSAIIPIKVVKIMFDLIKGKNTPDEILYSVHGTRIKFNWMLQDGSRVEVFSKTIDGTFPDYKRVIPSDCDRVIDVNSSNLMESIKNVGLIASKKNQALQLIQEGSNLTLLVADSENGSAENKIECESNMVDAFRICVGISYLTDTLSVAQSDTIQIKTKTSVGPMIIKNADCDKWFAVQMPIRIPKA